VRRSIRQQPAFGEPQQQRWPNKDLIHEGVRSVNRPLLFIFKLTYPKLYCSCLDVTLANKETPAGDIDPAWDELHNVVVTLGQVGMSSDESDHEEPGRPRYIVKKRDWRNRDLIRYLALIDHDRNTTNVYGNTQAGNAPRYRPQRHGNTSARFAVPDLPINFYDAGWLDTLNNGERKSL
jgi:hypothetical protein